MKLRVRSSAGVSNIDIKPETSFAALKQQIGAHSLRTGFPPKPIEASEDAPVSSFLSNGDMLIAQTTGVASNQPSTTPPKSAITPASKLATPPSSSILSQGTLKIRVVPDDNSCLFRSVGALLGRRNSSPANLRRIVATVVRENPLLYSEAILGKSPAAYCAWITSDNAWGGAIELAILAQHFKIELAAFDVKTMRLDRYGEGNSYKSAAYLVYDGIHYNYIALALMPGDSPSDLDVTQFEASDAMAMSHVRALVQKEHDGKKFTDTASFQLKCGQCGLRLKGERQALEHAKQTGHSQFTEN